jgi:hypothetical protein
MYQRDGRITHNTRPVAAVELRNLRDTPRQVVTQLSLVPTGGQPIQVRLQWPDGMTETLAVGSEEVAHRRELVLPPGTSHLRLVTDGPRPRGYFFRLADLVVVDVSLSHLVPPPAVDDSR